MPGQSPVCRLARRIATPDRQSRPFIARRAGAVAYAMAALLLAAAAALHAAPEGGSAVHGNADIERDGATTTITTSRDAILRFDSFDLTAEEAVRFVQPDAASRVLNRINGSAPSRIDGAIWSNGAVYLVNPAGVMFGPNAVVDVGGFYAGAARLSDRDFLDGIDRFTATGPVVNRGTIRADRVALIGRRVANLGAIHAPGGMVALAAGERVMLSDRDRRIYIRIDHPAGRPPEAGAPHAPPADADAAIRNEGTIDAPGGGVSWGAGDMYAMGLHQSTAGSVRAETVHAEAGPASTADIGGRIDASRADGAGGDVAVTAGRVEVRGEIDASGRDGGGSIRLGGGRRGATDLPHARVTRVHPDATLRADAEHRGEGGQVIAYADRFTAFAGHASARGGAQGGDGGFVEASAPTLHFNGTVDLAAPAGRTGTLLFDPTDINIIDGGPGADDGNLPDLSQATRGGGTFEIAEQALEALAADANLVLEATNDITVQDIADDRIALPIDGDGSVVFHADFDADDAGRIVFNDPNDALVTEGGAVTLIASDMTLGAIDTTGASGTVSGGSVTIETAAAAADLAIGDDPGGDRLHLDPGELGAIATDLLNLNAEADVVIDNVPAGTTGSIPTVAMTSAAGDLRAVNNATTFNSGVVATAEAGDVDLLAQLSLADNSSFEAVDGDVTLSGSAIFAPGAAVGLIADADGSAGGAIQADLFDPGHVAATRVELTSGASIGTATNPVELAGAGEIVLDAGGNVFVDGDAATSPTLFALAVDPGGAFDYRFNELPDESISGNASAIVADGSGNLLINTAEAAPGDSTSYRFTAKTGDLRVDDAAGDGGIFSGDGGVSLTARAGSVLPETPRDAFNIRTNALADGPAVTLAALNADGAGGHVASVGGDGAADRFIDVENASRFVIDARDHANVGGSGQPVTALDVRLDPAAPGLGGTQPTYQLLDVEDGGGAALPFDIASDGTDLTVNNVTLANDADLAFTAYTGHLNVTTLATAGGAVDLTTLQQTGDRGDVNLAPDAVASGGGTVTVRATAAPDGQGGIAPPEGAPAVGDGNVLLGPNAIDAGAGEVGLFAGAGVDETDADDALQQVNVTTADRLFIRARGDVGDAASVGDETIPTQSHLDIDVDTLNAESTNGGNLVIKDQGADGMTVERAVVSDNAFVRVDAAGEMTVNDGSVFSPNSFVWLASEAGIAEPAGDDPATPNAIAGGNVRFDAEGDIGDAADPFDVSAAGLFALVGQGAFGGTEGASGGAFVSNLDTGFDLFQLQVFDGDVAIDTAGDMTVDGFPFFSPNRDPQFEPFKMDNPGDITLASTDGGTITIQNADLDDPAGFDNFANLTIDGPTVVTLNPQFFDNNNQLAQAGDALFQGETVTINGALTVANALTGFEIDATGDVAVTGPALFEAPDQQVFQLPTAVIAGDNVAFDDALTSEIGFQVDAAGDFTVAGAAEFTQPDPAPFQPATAVIQAAAAAFDDALTTAVAFQINAAGDIAVAGAADFGAQALLDGADVSFDSPVTLGGQMNITGDNVAFNDTVASGANGDQALQVDTRDDGVTEFFGAVGDGGANPLFLLTTNADGITILHADVFTRGRQAYFDHLQLAADLTLTDAAGLDADGNPAAQPGSGIFFNTVGSDGTPRDLTVVTETDPAALAPISPRVAVIGFGGDVGVDADGNAAAGARLADLRLNPAGNRPNAPALATIAAGARAADDAADLSPADALDFDLHLDGVFEMGLHEKMTVLGDATLNLNAAGAGPGNVVGRLSDINATGRLDVDANGGDLVLLDHAPSPAGLLRPDDRNANGALDEFLDAQGLDFWAADGIAFTNVNDLTTATGGSARFVSTRRGSITGVGGFPRAAVAPFPAMSRRFGGATIALDPAERPIFNLGQQLPQQFPPDVRRRVRIPLTTPAFMNALNLEVRGRAPAERLTQALGAAMIDDLTLARDRTGRSAPAMRRIRAQVVPGVVDAYRKTFYTPEAGPEGETIWRPRFKQLRAALAKGFEAYRQATGEKPTSPRALRTFFEQTGQGAPTLAVLDALRAVYLELYQLGLTEAQWSRLLYQLAAPIAPEGYSADFVNQAALGQGG